nr:DNA internalization-related competence protein ComEC/Rec2 [Pseudomaricurvus alcaniphilus]
MGLVALCPSLPSLTYPVAALCVVAVVGVCRRDLSWPLLAGLLLLCCCRGILWGDWQLQNRVAASLEGADMVLEGYVDGLPERQPRLQRFNFQVRSARRADTGAEVAFPAKVRLSHYIEPGVATLPPLVAGGESWRLLVRVKRPYGFVNPGGFDYELWLLNRGIGATGYVRQLIAPLAPVGGAAALHRWREKIRQRFFQDFQELGQGRVLGVLLALTLGDKSYIDSSARDAIRESGLSHLLAISGLHISVVAAFGFLLGRHLGGVLSLAWPLALFGPRVGVAGGVALAGSYSLLSGFGIPAQRAMIMLLVWSAWYLSNRRFSAWDSWSLALLAVLWLQPLALLEAGFWFSFAAVASLIHLSGKNYSAAWGKWALLVFLQVGLFLLLGVLQVFWGLGLNPWSPLINLVAIPFVSLLVVPLALLATLAVLILPPLAAPLLWLVQLPLAAFWRGLDGLAAVGGLAYFVPLLPLSLPALLVALLGIALLLSPLPAAMRAMGVAAALVAGAAGQAVERDTRVTVLDVGQGLAVVVESGGEVLLYDTGPRFSARFDAGRAVLLPYFSHRAIRKLDTLVVSHGDSDHSGGYSSVVSTTAVQQLLLGEVFDGLVARQSDSGNNSGDFCNRDRTLLLGRVVVHIIGLGQDRWPQNPNNRSCVLLLEVDGHRLLLPGDIEHQREQLLLQHPLLQAPVAVMLVPHHGSQTSSTRAWVERLRPHWAVVSAGYRNRYKHPHADVLQRYRQVGSQLLCSSDSGALTFIFEPSGQLRLQRYRQQVARYWRYRQPQACPP